MKNDLSKVLAKYPGYARSHPMPKDVMEEAKRRVLDSLGCYLGAFHFGSPSFVRRAYQNVSSGSCSIWGTKKTASPEIAALVNGAGVRALDFNDTYLSKEPCHPSDLLPSFWAALEVGSPARPGKTLLKAMVLGYEVLCRLCDAASLRSRGFDHVTYLPIASAVGCSFILGLTEKQTRNAIALAMTGQIALRQTRVGEISDWKAACAANAARGGLMGALLAKEGMTGPADIFSGKNGFQKLISGPLKFKNRSRKDLWKILKTHVKFYPAEHHAQSAIEAAVFLKPLVPIASIQKITIKTFEAGASIIGSEKEKWLPETRETADHSFPFLTAMALLEGKVSLDQYEKKKFLSKKARALMKKIHIVRDKKMDKRYPADLGTELEIRLEGGRTLRKTIWKPKGYAGNPMGWPDLILKFNGLARKKLSNQKQKKLITQVRRLEKLSRLPKI